MKKIVAVVAVLFVTSLLLPAVGSAQSKEDAIRLHKEASALKEKAQSHADLKKAEERFLQAIAVYQRVGEQANLGRAYNSVGLIYEAWVQYGKAVEYFEKSLAIVRELKDRKSEATSLNNLGLVFAAWGQYDKAVEYYQKDLAICRDLKNRKGEGNTLNHLGNVYQGWGQYDKAVEYYEKSLAIARELKDPKAEANALGSLGLVFAAWGQYDKAVQYYEKSLAIARYLKDRKLEGQNLLNLGNVYRGWGQYDKAVEYYRKDLAICRDLKNRKGEAYSLGALGIVFLDWGQYDKAVEYYEKSLAIARELRDRKSEGNSLNNLGIVYKVWGRYDKAVEYYEKSLAMKRDLKDPKGEGATLNNLGSVFAAWGQYDKAVDHFEKDLAICRDLKDPKGEGTILNNLGSVFAAWGQYDKALECYEKSLAIRRDLKNPKDEGQTLMNVGGVLQHREEHKKALELFQKGLAIWTEIKVPTHWPKALIADTYMDTGDLVRAEPLLKEANFNSRWGRFYLIKSDYPKAKEYYGKILKTAEENRNADNLFTAYTGLGAACEGLKDDAGAVEHYENAVKHTEEIRSSLSAAERETFFDARINGFTRTAPYEGLARVQMRLNKPLEAFKTTEYTRARVFAEAMSRSSGKTTLDVPAEIVTQDNSINNELASLKKNLQKAFEKKNKLVIQSLAPRVKQGEGKLQAHIKMLREKYPLFAATKYPQPMDLSQTAVKENEWTLSYDVTGTGLLIYLTKGRSLVTALFKPVPRKEVDGLVRKFREPLEVKEGQTISGQLKKFDFAAGKKLADLLLSDVLPSLPKDTPVIVVPGGSLGIVPFEMLPLNAGGKIATDKERPYVTDAEFFGDRNPISYYQSITALTLARTFGKQKGAGDKSLVMDDPVFDVDDIRLQQAAREQKQTLLAAAPDKLQSAIKQELDLGFDRLERTRNLGEALKKMAPNRTEEYHGMEASKKVLFDKRLDGYSSIVFATHGYFGKDLPGIMEPVLVLTLVNQPSGKDGYLRLSEVMGLKLNADMVALTACQTGLGRHISGEGTMGMGRAFQYAGAKSVLMSLWSVSEQASVNMVENFFKHLNEGKSKLEALKLARDEVRKNGYDHPFYWAPFILVGEVQ
ncbi:MAG: CHAT domain-containing tetratricopeptide repeat protein [Pseudomonadota bacterium]